MAQIPEGVHTGLYISRWLAKRNMTQSELATNLNKSQGAVSHLVTGRKRIDAEIANLLSQHLGETPVYWMDLQRDQDLEILRHPLSSNTEQHTIVEGFGALVDHQIENMVEQGLIHIEGYDADMLQSGSYDMTLGMVFNSSEGSFQEVIGSQKIESGDCIRVTTLQYLELDSRIYASMSPSSKVAELGLFASFGTHIDPGYEGYLHVTLLNPGKKPVSFPRNVPFITLQFFKNSETPSRPYPGSGYSPKRPTTQEKEAFSKPTLTSEFSEEEVVAAMNLLRLQKQSLD